LGSSRPLKKKKKKKSGVCRKGCSLVLLEKERKVVNLKDAGIHVLEVVKRFTFLFSYFTKLRKQVDV